MNGNVDLSEKPGGRIVRRRSIDTINVTQKHHAQTRVSVAKRSSELRHDPVSREHCKPKTQIGHEVSVKERHEPLLERVEQGLCAVGGHLSCLTSPLIAGG